MVLVPKGISMTGSGPYYFLANLGWKCCVCAEGDAKSCSSAQRKNLENVWEPEPHLVPGKPVACPHTMRGFLLSLKGRGEAKGGSQRTCYWCCLCVVGKGSPGRKQRNLPRNRGAPLTLGRLTSHPPCGRCFWGREICGKVDF